MLSLLSRNKLFLFALLGNFWIWKVFFVNPVIGILLCLTAICLYLSFSQKFFLVLFLVFFVITAIFQVKTTEKISLTNLDNDEQRLHQQRLKEYEPLYIQVGTHVKWIPDKYWLEERMELFVFQRLGKNLFENLDINNYFFSNHPRERLGVEEFEKFPYIFLPFFIVGIFLLTKQKNKLLLIFIIPLLVLAVTGNKNVLGPFIFFPLFVVSIYQGLWLYFKKLASLSKKYKNILIGLSVVLFIVVYVQLISYVKF